jgi:hypothetical protein
MTNRQDADVDAAERNGWRLGLVLAIGVLLVFLAGIVARTSPSFEAWQARLPIKLTGLLTPDSLSPAHQRFGAQCSTCHQAAFTAVGDAACVECHKAVARHRNKPGPSTATSPEPPCIDCHIAHRNKAAVVDTRSAPCVTCHSRQEARLAANRDFSDAHAPFRLTLFSGNQETRLREDAATLLREKSGLKFSHAAHLKKDGVSSPEGQTILGCTSCHQPDAGGQGFNPPQMESSCQQSGCHRARFAAPMRGVVPHVPERVLMDRMRSFFAARLADDAAEFRQRCVGANPAGSAGRRLLDCANDLARDAAARSLFRASGEDLGCALCHELAETGQREAPWKIEPVRWTVRWHASADFPHARHSTISCGDCHSKSSSKEAADVSIPGIAKCRECHAGATAAEGRIATGCADCHAFHRHAAALPEGLR